ncbi:hypothetical protein RE476_08340 [Methanolobus mangrovi]|uniref:Uncharacterized protein n=1 Tax=Methanolobus mangrovi TaxID=3072977 RepID=A0AA51UED2_9EURY|nr:hypothetical protein [Methanolobus mangrovi]WMW21413.1 hypothetical protein RE476_08340 [Methanolobus mangrovi]
MRREITISFALLMILFSTAIPGVYAMEDDTGMEMPEMDAAQMKEMTLGMIENNIDSLTNLQSELDDEELLDSVDDLLEQVESLKTELESTDDEEAIFEIMDEFRSLMEEAPEEVRDTLMQNGQMSGEGQNPMGGNRTMMEGNESMQAQDGDFHGNGSMTGEERMNKPTDSGVTGDETIDDDTSEETTGLLSGLINMIKGLF